MSEGDKTTITVASCGHSESHSNGDQNKCRHETLTGCTANKVGKGIGKPQREGRSGRDAAEAAEGEGNRWWAKGEPGLVHRLVYSFKKKSIVIRERAATAGWLAG